MKGTAIMVSVRYRYVYEDRDRHGNVRLYFWRKGSGKKKIRLRETPGTAAFQAEYDAALKAIEQPATYTATPSIARAKPGTWRWLCEHYFASGEFRQLEPSTQTVRRRILEATFDEPRAPGAKEIFADCPVDRMSSAAIVVLRDRKGDLFEAANNRLKAIHRVFTWAMDQKPQLARSNPAAGVRKLRRRTQGHHTWTIEEVEQYEARHPRGTTARLALALLLYTGQRRSDVPRLGRQHVTRKNWLRFTQFKNRNRNPTTLEIPMIPALQQELSAAPTGELTFLVTAHGRPFSIAGFGNKMRQWCDEAGLPHCSAHGLRKAGAVRAAENGATAHQLQAIFGWKTLSEAQRYTRAAEQRRLAGSAMGLLARTKEG